MTAARNASYDVIERRKRAMPTDEVPDVVDPEVPERPALREAHQEQIRVANLSLPPRQREVLALRELQDLSYDEVAQIMGMNQNSVAQLISRARINLRDGLRQTALGSVASASPQCDRALPLLASYQDGVLEDAWLAEHLVGCGPCRVRLEAMEEAAVAYRQWLLLVPALWLREETAQAHERMSARAKPRGRKLLAAAGAAFVLLAFLAVDGAETPTRAYAPAATPTAEPVIHATPAAKAERRAPKPRRRAAKLVAAKPRVTKPVNQSLQLAATANDAPVAATDESPAVTTDESPAAPVRSKPRARPRRDRQPVPAPVVLADPPPVEQPATHDDPPPPPPEPPCTGANCPGTQPPCPGTAAGTACPPPRPPVPTCRTCGLVAPTPTPTPKPLVLTTRP
jgi:DNA-binding CsgD family transcriptional regulator